MKNIFKNQSSIKIFSSEKAKILSALMENNLSYYNFEISGDVIILTVSLFQLNDVILCLKRNGFKTEIEKKEGIITNLLKIKNRPGILIGIVFMLIVTLLSSKILWRIEIEGNINASNDEIISALEESGLCLGSFISGIDYDKLHNNVLMKLDSLSWISVNIDGNVARVKVEETKKEAERVQIEYSNIVASDDAQISEILVINGEKIINNGKVVKKGELLVSGVIDSQSMGVRYVDANAKILGYVNKKINITIPLKSLKKIYTGQEFIKKEYKIFNNISFFSINYGNLPMNYDTITKEETVDFFGISNIPCQVVLTKHLEYYEKEQIYTLDEAEDIALVELRNQLDFYLKDAELINKTINTSYDSENYYVDCEIYFIKDICEKNIVRVNSN